MPTEQRFVALGIDPGGTSGWALATHAEEVMDSGFVTKAHERQSVCEKVKSDLASIGLPLVVVVESWSAGGWKSYKSLIGLGKAFGQWLDHLELILGVKEAHLLRVHERKWRSHLFEAQMLKDARNVKNGMKHLACAFTGKEDHNEAEACCLALFAQSSVEGLEAVDATKRRLHKARSRNKAD